MLLNKNRSKHGIRLNNRPDLRLNEIISDYAKRLARYNYLTLGLLSDHFIYAYNLSDTRPLSALE